MRCPCGTFNPCVHFANALANSRSPFEFSRHSGPLGNPVKRPKTDLPCWIALLRRLKDGRGLDIVTEQCLRDGANTANRWMSDDDVLELYDEAKSSAHDEPIATKLAFLLGKFEGEDEVLVWDVEAVALAIHAQQIPEVYEASRASYDALIETALSHERGRSVLLPQILAALSRTSLKPRGLRPIVDDTRFSQQTFERVWSSCVSNSIVRAKTKRY